MQFSSPLSLINTGIVSRAFCHRRVLPGPVRINPRDCLECLLVIHFFNQIKQLCPIYRLLKHWIKWRVRPGGPWAERERERERERELLTVSVNKLCWLTLWQIGLSGWAGTERETGKPVWLLCTGQTFSFYCWKQSWWSAGTESPLAASFFWSYASFWKLPMQHTWAHAFFDCLMLLLLSGFGNHWFVKHW